MARKSSSVHGVVVVDKPAGPTSHDVVDVLRRALKERRVGHTGTLDPFATGVLALCVGRATRLARFLTAGEKVYEASVRLGFETDTDDLTGNRVGETSPVLLERARLEDALANMLGEQEQVAPVYSAKRRNGKRLYDLARAGVPVDPPAQTITISSLRLVALQGDRVDLEVTCSAGTYIRALARDLGRALGVGGHLAALRRTRNGPFRLNQAAKLEEVRAGGARLIPLSDVPLDLPALRVTSEGVAAALHGRDVAGEGAIDAACSQVRLLDPDGGLVAIASRRATTAGPELWHPEVVVVDAVKMSSN